MNFRTASFLSLLLLLLLAVGDLLCAAQPVAGSRAVFGVVPAEAVQRGVVVEKVAAASPAEAAGLRAGDMILRVNGVQMSDMNALRAYVADCRPGDVLRVSYSRGGNTRVALVELAARTASAPMPAVPQVAVPYEIRVQMRQARARIRLQLGALPYRMKTAAVVADLYELRNLALSLQESRPSYAPNSVGEAELEFADAHGRLILHTQNHSLTLTVQDASGRVLSRYPLNTPQECRVLPRNLVRRMQAL